MEIVGENKTRNSTDDEFTPNAGIYVLAVVVIMTAIASVLGNILVQIAFWRTPTLRASSPAILAMVLAVTDFCMAIFVMPFVVMTAIEGGWSQSHQICVASGFVNTLLTAVQFGVLFCISVNRFVAISFPHHYQLRWTTKTTTKLLFLLLSHSLVWSVMPFLSWGSYGYKQDTLFCNVNWSKQKTYTACLHIFCYVIPAIVAAILYTIVFVKIRKIRQSPMARMRMNSQNDSNTRPIENDEQVSISPGGTDSIQCFHRRSRVESRLNNSLLLVATAFAILWLPRGLVNLSVTVTGNESVPRPVEYTTSVFIFMSSFVNPIIYALYYDAFQKAFRAIICRGSN